MKPDKVLQTVEFLRRNNKGYLSNSYFSKQKLMDMLANETLRVINLEGILCICDAEDAFVRVYWYVDSSARFGVLAKAIANTCGESPVISEIIGTDVQLRKVSDELEQAGFDRYMTLRFMSRKPSGQMVCLDESVDFPLVSDAIEIYKCLHIAFDPLVSHLPSLAEIEAGINNKEISVIFNAGKISAFAIFKKTGKLTKYLYQIWVDPDFRGKGYAKTLICSELAANNDMVYTLWVETENSPALRLYEKLGFTSSDRYTLIMHMGGKSKVDNIYEILKELRPEFDYHDSDSFIEDGMLDSFDIVSLVSELEEQYGILIDGMDIVPENFASVANIASVITKNGGKL